VDRQNVSALHQVSRKHCDSLRQGRALFDEYQSKENGKHVMRALKENAR